MTIDDFAVLVQNEFQIMREELATKTELYSLGSELREEMLALRRDTATKNDLALLAKRTERLEEKMDAGFHAVIAEIHDIRRVFQLVDSREKVINLEVRMGVVEQKLGLGA
jgi:hypothetical protein